MKKLLSLLLTLVMVFCLVNLNNNHTKADDVNLSTPFTITVTEGVTTVTLIKNGDYTPPTLQFSLDGTNWNNYTYGTGVDLIAGQSVSFKTTNESATPLSQNPAAYINVTTTNTDTSKISASGNIMSLVNKNFSTNYSTVPGDDCFYSMFINCANLVSIDNLIMPATTLTDVCYSNMFEGCTGLTSIPENLLPATNLSTHCYYRMFKGCTALTSLPEGLLPATNLKSGCYSYMFFGCTGLTSLPENLLPAGKDGQGSLAYDCYYLMFGCTGLISLPAGLLPATTLVSNCYTHMFEKCTKLTNIPNLPATTLADACYLAMFLNCSSLKISATKVDNYTIPFVINYDESVQNPVDGMFAQTGGTFSGAPQSGVTYYVATPTTPTECSGSTCSISATKGSNGITAHITENISPSDVTSITAEGSTLVSGKDYTLYQGSLGVVLTKLYVDSLSVGSHEITINYNDSGTPKTYTLNITVSEKPSPSPSPSEPVIKDESCEKVIGPTWHWNNTKGVCEEYATVGTSTR